MEYGRYSRKLLKQGSYSDIYCKLGNSVSTCALASASIQGLDVVEEIMCFTSCLC